MDIGTIKIIPDRMREVDSEYFTISEFSDSDLENLTYTISINDMELDLYNTLGIANKSNKLVKLNNLINIHQDYFIRLLMYCQLKNYFYSLATPDSINEIRYKNFRDLYSKELQFSKNLNTSDFKPIKTIGVLRG